MASHQPTREAAARESRANAKEDMALLTSGAREKVDHAFATAKQTMQHIIHPFSPEAKEASNVEAREYKRETSEKQAAVRAIAQQQASQERLAARTQVANLVLGGAGGMRYPVAVHTDRTDVDDPHPADDHPRAPEISTGAAAVEPSISSTREPERGMESGSNGASNDNYPQKLA
ncbi:hypothetical protein O6H91_05G116900 [Diphasiastrum complanatum]|uniref:Uncharacterized protein n=1 Tax=Diphasiastrum complanatum TaxID=34168 RepID=A0ACC2DSM3_DIPCM|nr:hypothetical protein O6H91_05G116900 [Diphasiastrum complanatum]